MKKALTVLLVVLTTSVFGIVPQKMSYQAVVRNASNALVANSNIGMQVSILQNSPTGNSVYVERQFPTTNANGLVTIEIGAGTLISGSFSTIDWSTGFYFIKTEVDLNGGADYTIVGTSQILSVPYALHANTASQIPALTQAERDALSPQVGAVIYNKLSNKPNYFDGQLWRHSDGSAAVLTIGLSTIIRIGNNSAAISNNIISDGGIAITERGVCWSTTHNPTIANSKTSDGTSAGSFTSTISGLAPLTTYFVRAYATNSLGVTYANEISFTTFGIGPDIDGDGVPDADDRYPLDPLRA